MNLEKLVKCLRKKYEKPLFILFSSDLHGARKIHNSKNVKKKDLEKLGYKVVIVEDQKASWLAKELRKIHIERDVKVDPIAEMLLILAARRQNIVDYFIPYLQEGYIVIGERYNDAPAEIALVRIKGKKHRFEREAISFHEKVRQGYLFQARRYPERIIIIDATRSIEEVYRCLECRIQ